MSRNAVEVRDLKRIFDRAGQTMEVLASISFVLNTGQSVALTGPSGSGKSTLLQLLGTLDAPSSGQILIEGSDPFALSEPELALFRNRHIGFVFQTHHLLPQYSVMENVLVPTLAYPTDPEAARARASELVAAVGLSDRAEHRPSELSGGECQRVAVARALIQRPALLLCDEPTGSLDRDTARQIGNLLFDLHGTGDMILVTATHDLDLASRFQRHFTLEQGTCVER